MFAFPRLAGALAVSAGLLFASQASAFGPATAPATAMQHKGTLAELHKAHTLLMKADHDYDGHRAKAAHEVHEAIHELMASHKHTAATTTGTTAGKTATAGKAATTGKAAAGSKENMKMSQEESDKMLQEAMKVLGEVMPKIQTGHKAHGRVSEAIKEIGVALSKK